MTNNNNDNNNDIDQEQEEAIHINAEPVIAVFIYDEKCYVSTPETNTPEYYIALSSLIHKISQDSPTLFNELKALINSKVIDQAN